MSKEFLDLGFKSAEINGLNIGYVYDSNGIEYIAYTSESASSKDVWHIERRNVNDSSCPSLIIFVGGLVFNVAETILRYIKEDINLITQNNNFMSEVKTELNQVRLAALEMAKNILTLSYKKPSPKDILQLADEVYAWLTKEDEEQSEGDKENEKRMAVQA